MGEEADVVKKDDPIDRITPFVVPYTEPNDHGSTRYVCLVKVTTADGRVGWGEAVTLFEEAARATAELVAGFATLLTGTDADPHSAADRIRAHAWWYGDGGIASFAKAAIDIALWDITARAREVSLLEALGGPVHDRLPATIACHATENDIRTSAEQLAGFVDAVHARGIKVAFGKRGAADLGRDHERDVAFVRALREELGPDPLLMVDISPAVRWSAAEAIARTKAFEEYGLYWIEEPLGADDPPGYARLHAASDAMIAYGEREWSPRGIRRIVDTGTVDVVGIDPGRAEGITGFSEAARYIQSAGRQANAHAFAGPIVYAASLALSLSSASCHQLEVPPHRNGLYDLVDSVPAPVDGHVHAIDGPGLGIDVDERAVTAAAR